MTDTKQKASADKALVFCFCGGVAPDAAQSNLTVATAGNVAGIVDIKCGCDVDDPVY